MPLRRSVTHVYCSRLHYRAGYKYQTQQTVRCLLPALFAGPHGGNEYVHLRNASLTISAGYAWDGPSGPAVDTPDFMRASLVHDALYQLIGLRVLSPRHRKPADQVMRDIALHDGMPALRANWTYWAVRLAAPRQGSLPRPILSAP